MSRFDGLRAVLQRIERERAEREFRANPPAWTRPPFTTRTHATDPDTTKHDRHDELITYEPTRDHWTPYEPWMLNALAPDARMSWIDTDTDTDPMECRAPWNSLDPVELARLNTLTPTGLMRWLGTLRVHPDDVPERPTEDIALRAHRAAVQHLRDLTEARWAEEDGDEVDWTELGTTATYDGCDDCIVREVATVVIAELEAAGAIQVLDPDDERGGQG